MQWWVELLDNLKARPAGDWNPEGGPGVNFDFGFVEIADGKWTMVHANHAYNPDLDKDGKGDLFPGATIYNDATVYTSSLKEWRKNNSDFNAEVWCVTCALPGHMKDYDK
jgi:hypothetical protein